MSTGAVYTYFPNKESMMRAILERAREERHRALAAAKDESGLDQSLVLLEWVTAIWGEQGRHAARVDVNLWAEALRNPAVHELAHDALREAAAAVAAVVNPRLASSPAGAAVDGTAVAQVLIAIFLGLEVQTAVGLRLDSNRIVKTLAALFADYLPNEAATPPPKKAPRSRKKKRS